MILTDKDLQMLNSMQQQQQQNQIDSASSIADSIGSLGADRVGSKDNDLKIGEFKQKLCLKFI